MFWTLDIGLNFFTGYFEETVVITDWKKIAKHYVSRWFLFDMIVILPDWATLMLRTNVNITNTLSALRMMKVIRMLRLMRLAKMRRVIGDISSRIQSDAGLTMVRLAGLLLAIVICLHIIACFWYLVGDADGGWVITFELEGAADGYIVALHWALTLMQGNVWSTTPLTIWERLFTVIILPIALVFTALFIGSTTMLMQQSTGFARDLAGQRSSLRTVARHYKFPPELCVRIRHFIEADKSLRNLREREDRLLKELSPDLQRDLKMQIYGGLMSRHAFMTFLMSRDPPFVRHVCSVLATHDFVAGEIIFSPGDACKVVRFLVEGRLLYVHGHRLEEELTLSRGHCVSEAVLWTLWEHCGELVSLSVGSCALLESDSFEEIVKLYPMVTWLSVLYSRQFIIHLNKNLNKNSMSDIVEPPAVQEWEPEAIVAIAKESGADLPFEDELPSHCSPQVVKACVLLSQDVATRGLDENRPHHGFTVIIGEEAALDTCGRSGFNPFKGHDVRVITEDGLVCEEAIETVRRNAFHTDGAIVVDGLSGRVVASSWFVGDIRLGGMDGGARSRSARSVAQQAGGCYVIKCSEDSRGKLVLHLGAKTRVFNSQLKTEDVGSIHEMNSAL